MKLALFVAAALLASLAAAGANPAAEAVSPKGRWLAEQLDALGVETKWIAGARVDWRTGLPDGRPKLREGRHTHCSAFVAAAAESLGVYILRPPEHGQALLANAQFRWLADDGADDGWRALPDAPAAQAAANAGDLVVASYLSHRDRTPGHIAIVRPSPRSAADLAAEGPLVIQAGTVNRAAVSLREGFSGHPAAWRDDEVAYYAHTIAEPGGAQQP